MRSTHARPDAGSHERTFLRLSFSVVDANGPTNTIESRNLFFFRSYASAAGRRLHERVVDEAGAEHVIAFGQLTPQLFLGVRIEVDRGPTASSRPSCWRSARRPSTSPASPGAASWPFTWRPLAGKADADRVVAGELDAVFGFDGAAIDAADPAVARAIVGLDRLWRNLGGDRPARRSARPRTDSAPSGAARRSAHRRCCRSRRPSRRPGSTSPRGSGRRADRGSCWCTRSD